MFLSVVFCHDALYSVMMGILLTELVPSGRTGRAGSTGRATSFWTDRDSFVVTQIKKALSELESGNTFAFATGKAARQKEKEMAAEFKDKIRTGPSAVVATGGAEVKVDDKFKFMTAPTTKAGAADDAWDD